MIQIEREEGTISDYGGNELIDGDRPNESWHFIRCIKGTVLRIGSRNVFWSKVSYKASTQDQFEPKIAPENL